MQLFTYQRASSAQDAVTSAAGPAGNRTPPTDAPTQVQYLCEDSSTCVLFIQDEEQLDMFRAAVGIHNRKNLMMEAAE
mgnify:CR=1 FL=1